MEMTRAASYAFHALAYMAQLKTNDPVPSHKIARERGIPERFLLKVLKPLVDAGILDSIKGPTGGYRLVRSLTEVTFLEVIEAADQKSVIGKAPKPQKPKKPEKFPSYDPAVCMPVYRKLEKVCEATADQIRKHLEGVKVSEILKR